MKTNYLHIIFALWSIQLCAQSGPGGVGNSTNISTWYRADAGTFTDLGTTAATSGQQVRQWNDQSGNGRNAIQNTAGSRPILRNGQANGFPGLRFTGNTFIDGPSLGIASTSSYTYILTFRDTATSLGGINDGSGHFILDRTSATNNLVSLKPITGNVYGFQKRNNAGGGLGGPLSTSNINTSVKSIQMRRLYNTNYQIFYNGSMETAITAGDGATTPPNPRIGRHATTTNGGIRGYFFEFVIYNFELNSAQTVIVNNYLGAKYGYTLSANDIYVHDNVANGNFDYDVAGIGRTNSTNLHNDAQGTGIIRILNPSGLGNNEYLFWGHNNGAIDAIEFSDVPATVQARMARVWRVNEVNISGTAVDVGAIDIRWDLNGLGAITASDLRLLIDTDNDGLFNDETPISGATDLGSGIYEFAGVTAISNDMRFTMSTINSSSTPLPIELISFKVEEIDQTAHLTWSTASEVNNDYFLLDRSTDGKHWETIAQLDGAGTSNSKRSYFFDDNEPLNGLSYYRLIQTDLDGETSSPWIVSFSLESLESFIPSVYPNPATDYLNVDIPLNWDRNLLVINAQGKEVATPIIKTTPTAILLDVSELKAGNYFISIGKQKVSFIKVD